MLMEEDEIVVENQQSGSSSPDVGEPSSSTGLRHRFPWSDRVSLSGDIPGLREVNELLDDDDASCLAEEEDGVGCPLPSTPEDDGLLDCEVCYATNYYDYYYSLVLL